MTTLNSLQISKIFFLVLTILLSGCTSMIVKPIIEPLTLSLQRQQDIELLKDGAPSLLLMMDGLIEAHPDNMDLLLDGARSYAAYATALSEFGEKERAVAVSKKVKIYGLKLLALFPETHAALYKPLDTFTETLTTVCRKNLDKFFWAAYCWATWISFQDGSPASVADLPKVEKMMLRVLELDETFYYGAPHLFLGYYYGVIPAMYGGKPQQSRQHFERALAISNRNFLPVQVAFAESYAKLQFDRELFEKLLWEVLERPADTIPDLSAGNQMAKIRAAKLLAAIDDFF